MTMRGSIRLATAIVLMGICGFSVAQGWTIVRFSVETMNVESPEKRAEIAKMWGTTPGLASRALRTVLADKIDIADQKAANEQREALAAILSIKPLSSRDWLSLSGVQLVTDQPMDDVLESLKLSTLTGPNEGYVMVERGIYGVSLWEFLSPDLKSRVANDLLPVLFPRTPAGGSRSRKVTGPCLRTAPAGTQGTPRGAPRYWAFAKRDRARIGPLAGGQSAERARELEARGPEAQRPQRPVFWGLLRVGTASGFRVNLLITLIKAIRSAVLAYELPGRSPGGLGNDGVFRRSKKFGAWGERALVSRPHPAQERAQGGNAPWRARLQDAFADDPKDYPSCAPAADRSGAAIPALSLSHS